MRLKHLYLFFVFLAGLVSPAFAQEPVSGVRNFLQLSDTAGIRSRIAEAKKIAPADPVQASERFRVLLQQSLHMAYSYGVVVSAIESGNLKVREGSYDAALLFYNQALAACDASTRPLFAALIHNLTGNVCNLQARYEQASFYYYKAAQLAEQYPARQLPPSYAYSNLATVLAQLKQYDKAQLNASKALRVAAQLRDTLLQISQLMNIGVIYYQQQDYKQALDHLDRAAGLARHSHNFTDLHKIRVNTAAVHMAAEDPDKALQQLLDAAALEAAHPIDYHERNATLSSIGDVYMQLKQWDKARTYFSMAWTGSGQLPKERLFLLQKLAELKIRTGDYKGALDLRRQYDALSDSIESRAVTLQVHEMETRYRTAEKDREIALKQAHITRQAEQIVRKNLWLGITALGVLLLLLLGAAAWFYTRQKNKITERNRQIEVLHARLEGEEDERQRLAQELHDGIGSQLAGAKSYLLALGNAYPDLAEHHYFHRTGQILNETAADLRRVAHNLLPGVISSTGLADAVQAYCKDLGQRSDLDIEFHAYGNFNFVAPVLSLHIYRIIQELLHNVVKHAAASEAIVLLNEHPSEISILVEDNGKGISETQGSKGIGLVNIRKRVDLLSGNMQIESAGQTGTIISIFLPKDVQRANMASGRQFH